MELPSYFIIDATPVKAVPTREGGISIEAYDTATKTFVSAAGYLTDIWGHPSSLVLRLSEEEFQRKIEEIDAEQAVARTLKARASRAAVDGMRGVRHLAGRIAGRTRLPTVPAPSTAPVEFEQKFLLSLLTTAVKASPGSRVSMSARITNEGTVVDAYRLSVLGIEGWVEVSP